MALFRRKMNRGLQKTRDNFSGNLDNVLGSFESIDEDSAPSSPSMRTFTRNSSKCSSCLTSVS